MASNSMCNLCKLNFKSRAYLILHLGTYHGIQYPQSVAHTMSNRMGVEQPPTTSVEVPESSKKTEGNIAVLFIHFTPYRVNFCTIVNYIVIFLYCSHNIQLYIPHMSFNNLIISIFFKKYIMTIVFT